MKEISHSGYFTDNGNNKRERENFRNFIFRDLEIKGTDQFFSFYRSDFRGANITDCKFANTLFDMADFIDTSLIRVQFCNVEWGASEIKNCYFEGVNFNKNKHESSIQKSIFVNCHFAGEHFKSTIFDVTFKDCSFTNCDFEGSTLEDIKFINTVFTNCELSTMHAENFTFECCILDGVVWGIEYWFSYFIYKTKMSDIKLKYRGYYVDISKDKALFSSILVDLQKKANFFEYINILVLHQILANDNEKITIKDHLQEFPRIFDLLLNESSTVHRKKQMLGLFKLLQFYLFKDNFSLYDTMCIVEYVNSLSLDNISSDEALIYRAEVYKINEMFSEIPFNYQQILTLPHDYMISAAIRLDYDEYSEAKQFIDNTFRMLASMLNIGTDSSYTIIDTRKGSWEFEILSYAIIIVLFLKVIRGSVNFILDTKLRVEISSLVLHGLKENNSNNKFQLEKVQKSVNLLQSTGMLASEHFSPEIIGTEDLSKIISMNLNLRKKNL